MHTYMYIHTNRFIHTHIYIYTYTTQREKGERERERSSQVTPMCISALHFWTAQKVAGNSASENLLSREEVIQRSPEELPGHQIVYKEGASCPLYISKRVCSQESVRKGWHHPWDPSDGPIVSFCREQAGEDSDT